MNESPYLLTFDQLTAALKDEHAIHRASIFTQKVNWRRPVIKRLGKQPAQTRVRDGYGELRYMTQHERVVAGRRQRDPHYLA